MFPNFYRASTTQTMLSMPPCPAAKLTLFSGNAERTMFAYLNIILTFASPFHNTSPFAGFRIRPHGVYPVFSTFNLPLAISTQALGYLFLLLKGVVPFCLKGPYPFAQRGRTLLLKGVIPFCPKGLYSFAQRGHTLLPKCLPHPLQKEELCFSSPDGRD